MKILERKEWCLEIACKGCQSKLGIEAKDVRKGERGGSYCENGEEAFWIACPVCEELNWLPTNKIPSGIQQKARSRNL